MRRQLRLHAVRQFDFAQPLYHLLARKIGVGAVVEGDDDEREAKLGVRKHAHRIGQTGQRDLQRQRHLFLDLLSGAAGKQRDHGDLGVRHIRKRLDRQRLERDGAGTDEQDGTEQHEQRLFKRKFDEFVDHWAARIRSVCVI